MPLFGQNGANDQEGKVVRLVKMLKRDGQKYFPHAFAKAPIIKGFDLVPIHLAPLAARQGLEP